MSAPKGNREIDGAARGARDPEAGAAQDLVYRFVWVEEGVPAFGGQWLAFPPDGRPWPVALSDAVGVYRERPSEGEAEPLVVHVDATRQIVAAAGALEDDLFPDLTVRLDSALAAADRDAAEIDPDSEPGEQLRRAAEALEKAAADLADLVEEQLDGGSLATLPPHSTLALCQAVQAAWRLRQLVAPPGPLYL